MYWLEENEVVYLRGEFEDYVHSDDYPAIELCQLPNPNLQNF
jgi:hypothetical protein